VPFKGIMHTKFFAIAIYIQDVSFQGGKLSGKCTCSRETILSYKNSDLF